MPIYAYRCDACGFQKDVLQKMSDSALTLCPSCGASAFAKQLSAPAFQLKGTGWYVTDFRDNGKKADGGETSRNGTASGSGDKAMDKAADHKPDGGGQADGKAAAGGKGGDGKAAGNGSAPGNGAGKDGAAAKSSGGSPAAAPAAKPAAPSTGGSDGVSRAG